MRDIDEYSKAYLKSDFEAMMVVYRRRMILEQLDKYPHSAILEVGCGVEPLFKYMDGVDRWVVVEPSKLFCEQARQFVKPSQKVTIVEKGIEDAVEQLKGLRFDVIVCSSLLHELEKPENVLRAIHALAGENTVIHLNVPNALSFHRLLAVEMGLIDSPYIKSARQEQLQQHHTFDMTSLRSLVEREGFAVLESGSYFVKMFANSQLQKGLDQGVFDQRVMDGLYDMIKYFPDNGAEIFMNLRKAK